LISQGVIPLGGIKPGWGGQNKPNPNHFQAKCVNISKTVADTSKLTIND